MKVLVSEFVGGRLLKERGVSVNRSAKTLQGTFTKANHYGIIF